MALTCCIWRRVRHDWLSIQVRLDLIDERVHRAGATVEGLHGEFKDEMLHPCSLVRPEAGGEGINVTPQEIASRAWGIRQHVL